MNPADYLSDAEAEAMAGAFWADLSGDILPRDVWAARIRLAWAARPEACRERDAAYNAALKVASPPPEPQAGWRGIESAPRDGTEFIVYREDAGVFSAVWQHPPHEDGGLDWDSEPFLCSVGGEDLTSDPPTHWMPLPSPPNPRADQ